MDVFILALTMDAWLLNTAPPANPYDKLVLRQNATFRDGVLTVYGLPAGESTSITLAVDDDRVTYDGDVIYDHLGQPIDPADVTAIEVYGDSDAETIDLSNVTTGNGYTALTGDVEVYGGAGNDTIKVSKFRAGVNLTVDGGTGDDTVEFTDEDFDGDSATLVSVTVTVEQDGELTFAEDLTFGSDAEYVCHMGGETIGLIDVADGLTLNDDSTLTLVATGRLSAVGDHTKTIVEMEDCSGEFNPVPAMDEHLGYGVFFGDTSDPQVGVTHGDNSVTAAMFQAGYGDVDGDRDVDIFDILWIKIGPKGFGKGATDADWTDGDMVGATTSAPPNGTVDIFDIVKIKLVDLFGRGPYYPAEKGGGGSQKEGAKAPTPTVTLTYYEETGEMTMDNGEAIEALFIASKDSQIDPEGASMTFAQFMQVEDDLWGAVNFSGPFDDEESLGEILPSGISEEDLEDDLSFSNVFPDTVSIVLDYVEDPGKRGGGGKAWLTALAQLDLSASPGQTSQGTSQQQAVDLLMTRCAEEPT